MSHKGKRRPLYADGRDLFQYFRESGQGGGCAFFGLHVVVHAELYALDNVRGDHVEKFIRCRTADQECLAIFGRCGDLQALALIFQMIAIKMTLVPYLIAVKRTSVIMTSLFGLFLFKEKGLRERLIGVVLMVLGVLMISFFQ